LDRPNRVPNIESIVVIPVTAYKRDKLMPIARREWTTAGRASGLPRVSA
jgi:hypothetical protein